ncbi:hypothetical protein [Streptomyces sp. A1-5]|uniref:hypothetical protein n=1 Tax=Streptomyces sp. A1-5 TaxID=2738410 RepID=UPI001F447080|nr:hypothetical protein [Streptomyces sp. A1-5]UJB45339.1 hypothetical protein HRD51_35235 [Streptomyces sp. A1-5]
MEINALISTRPNPDHPPLDPRIHRHHPIADIATILPVVGSAEAAPTWTSRSADRWAGSRRCAPTLATAPASSAVGFLSKVVCIR